MSAVPGFAGAHSAGMMKAPDLDEFKRLQDAAGGKIKLITLAPEWPGSFEFIRALREQGCGRRWAIRTRRRRRSMRRSRRGRNCARTWAMRCRN